MVVSTIRSSLAISPRSVWSSCFIIAATQLPAPPSSLIPAIQTRGSYVTIAFAS